MQGQRNAATPSCRRSIQRASLLYALVVALGSGGIAHAQAQRAPVKAQRAAKPSSAEALPIEVPVGGRATVTLTGLTRLRIVEPALANVSVEAGGVVRIQGLARGQTELVFWREGREERRMLIVR